MKPIPLAAAALLSAALATNAHANPETLWGVDAANSSSGFHGFAEAFSLQGQVLAQVDLGAINPTGIAIVGQTAYFTNADNGNIGSFDINTKGVSPTLIATSRAALGALTWDGSSFWATDYEGGNEAYRISLSGTVSKTVTLANCGSYCSGLEYIPSAGLVANRGPYDSSATYDLYDLNGSLKGSYLSGVPNGAGLAYDTTSKLTYVSDYTDNKILAYNQAGSLVNTLSLGNPVPNTGFDGRFLADLAVDVPEPASAALFTFAVAGLGMIRRRR